MRAAERISAFAGVDLELAELVVRAAQVHHVPVKILRGDSSKTEKHTRARRWVAARARPRWSWWEIGRALNRDHSTIIHHHRRAKPANDARLTEPSHCGECGMSAEHPIANACTRTDCPLGHHRRRSLGAAADKALP